MLYIKIHESQIDIPFRYSEVLVAPGEHRASVVEEPTEGPLDDEVELSEREACTHAS